MVTAAAKKGRPTAYHRTSWGEKVDGLKRLADGRWKVSGPPVLKFTEPDERLAVARFYEIKSKRNGDAVDIPTSHTSIDDAAEAFIRRLPNNERTYIDLPVEADDPEPVRVSNWQPSAAVWKWFRDQILTQPKYVAKMTGIEEIGHLYRTSHLLLFGLRTHLHAPFARFHPGYLRVWSRDLDPREGR